MRKILFVTDGTCLDFHCIDFACYLCQLTGSSITGIFLENFVSDQKLVFRNDYDATLVDWEVDENSPEYAASMKLIEENISAFKESCYKRRTRCEIYRDKGIPVRELIHESSYADLLIISPETSISKTSGVNALKLVNEITRKARCPVIVAPMRFARINELIFCYDGSWQSFYAIKQFVYLFPEFLAKKITLLEVKKENDPVSSESKKVKEWLSRYFNDARSEVLYGNATKELFTYLERKEDAFVILGAHDVPDLGHVFKKAVLMEISKLNWLPFFVMHA